MLHRARRIGQHRPRWSASSDRAAAPARRRTAATVAHSVSLPRRSITRTAGKVLTTTCLLDRRVWLHASQRVLMGEPAVAHFDRPISCSNNLPVLRGGARRHPRPGSRAPSTAAERLHTLLLPAEPHLALHPGIRNSLTEGFREDLSEGLWNYVRANKVLVPSRSPFGFTLVQDGAAPDARQRRLQFRAHVQERRIVPINRRVNHAVGPRIANGVSNGLRHVRPSTRLLHRLVLGGRSMSLAATDPGRCAGRGPSSFAPFRSRHDR